MIDPGPKGHYVQEGPAKRATTFKKDQLEGQLRPSEKAIRSNASLKGHYDQKEHARRTITLKNDRYDGTKRS
jgi:hypothetical protein